MVKEIKLGETYEIIANHVKHGFKIGDKVFIISDTIYDLFCNPHIDNNLYYANDCVKIDEKNLKKSILECLDLNVSLYIYLVVNNILEDNFDFCVFEIHDIKEKSIIVEKKELKLFIEIDNSCLDCIYFVKEMFDIINLAFKYDLINHYLISNKNIHNKAHPLYSKILFPPIWPRLSVYFLSPSK